MGKDSLFLFPRSRVGTSEQEKLLRLRKVNRMRPVQGALAIYRAIRRSTAETDCSPFIEFMLQMILDAIDGSSPQANKNAGINAGIKLSTLDQVILELMRADPNITNAVLAEQTGKALSTIERRIKKLKEHHLLKRVGARKTGHWEVQS